MSLHWKLDLLTQSVKQPTVEEVIVKLTSKVQNLNLGNSTEDKPIVKEPPRKLFVWEDPKKQVEEYRLKYGRS